MKAAQPFAKALQNLNGALDGLAGQCFVWIQTGGETNCLLEPVDLVDVLGAVFVRSGQHIQTVIIIGWEADRPKMTNFLKIKTICYEFVTFML